METATFTKETLVKGQPTRITCLEVDGQTYTLMRTSGVRVARLEDEDLTCVTRTRRPPRARGRLHVLATDPRHRAALSVSHRVRHGGRAAAHDLRRLAVDAQAPGAQQDPRGPGEGRGGPQVRVR